ncbi:MAG TPA: antitoxin family protein [Pirellulales bacterium]
MSQEFEAIYENGVLRPLKPIGLREQEIVTISVASTREDAEQATAAEEQKALLLAFGDKMEAIAEPNPADGFTNRDHDRLIYGEST